ncbi:MAG: DUF6438 domain-containing protein [Candidatus Chryseobacterium colombiense]|nr:DUF6438 domain-containing protein [Chryseobacterium sp.]WEK69785.1 MAG: DUF6438 domain-containing protein [Chryseobacterium sp.]
MKYLFSLLTVVLLFSCSTQKNSAKYSSIEYEAGACFGSCPIFKITINPDRTAVLEAEHFNFSKEFSKAEFSKPREGTFKTTIKQEDYNKLIDLLNNLEVKNLNDKYGNRNVTDMATSYLRISFPDNTTKTVEDYGKKGTDKLVEVYKFFEDLRNNQQWTKVK